jgi:hypothetical protein
MSSVLPPASRCWQDGHLNRGVPVTSDCLMLIIINNYYCFVKSFGLIFGRTENFRLFLHVISSNYIVEAGVSW